MDIIFLALIVIFSTFQGCMAKEYSKRTQGGTMMFAGITVFFAMIVFVISFLVTNGLDFNFSVNTLWYAILFAFTYGGATVGSIYAVKTGSLSLTSLLTSFSLLIPTFYGIFVLNEETSAYLYIGLVLLCASLILVNFNGKEDSGNQKITFKWLIYVFISFVGNGICTITQKMQQINQNGMYKNEFMIVALLIVFVGVMIISLITEKNHKSCFKPALITGGARGLGNGIVNLLVISLAITMPASVLFPVVSGGGIALTAILAMTLYKERLSLQQILAMIFGIASVVFLNI